MSRNLLILALLVSGTGCSATRPLLSTIVVTPPRLSFRQLPREDSGGDSWHLTTVAVTYPSETLIPAPCAPSPVGTVELVTFIEEYERPTRQPPSGPVQAETTVDSVPPVHVPASAPSALVHLENTISPQSAHLLAPSVEPVPLGITSNIQASVAVTYPSGSLIPPACAPSPVPLVQLVTYFDEDEHPAPWFPSGPVPAVTTVVPVPPVHVPAPPVQVESPTPTESNWKPATRIAVVSPVQTSTAIRCDQDETTLPQVHPIIPVENLSTPVPMQPDLSELLTEIRNQRQLIEALQRDLSRERSADDSAIEELEAAVENLLVHTAQREMPTAVQK